MYSSKESENSAHSMCKLCLKIFDEHEKQLKITNSLQKKILEIFPSEIISFQPNLSHVCEHCSSTVESYTEFRSTIISRQHELMQHLQRIVPTPMAKNIQDVPVKVELIEPSFIKTEKHYDSDDGRASTVDEYGSYDYMPENQVWERQNNDPIQFENDEETPRGISLRDEELPCEICGKIVKRQRLKRHMATAHMSEEEKAECDACGKKFAHRRSLTRHVLSHIPKELRERTFQCDLCQKLYCTIEDLRNHKRLTHFKRPPKPETCHCGKTFASKGYLYQHVRNVHKRHEYEVSCKECGKIFLSMPQLNEHIRIFHTPGQKNKFMCNICGKFYHRQRDVNVHQKHHREKKFVCEVPGCGKKFIFPSELNKHIKIAHLNQKDFKCNYEGCNMTFGRRTHIRRHVQLIHEGFRRKCPVEDCSFQVGRRDYMMGHLKKHTNLSREQTEAFVEEIKGMGLL